MNRERIAKELVSIARELTGESAVPLVVLIDDRDRIVKKRGTAVEGVGIFDMSGEEYPAGLNRKGEVYAEMADSDNQVLLRGGSKRSRFNMDKRYPEEV